MSIGRVVSNCLVFSVVLAVATSGALPAWGQGEADCVAGELGLMTPHLDTLTLSEAGHRFGVTLRWDLLPDDETTCSVIADSAGFGPPLELTGSYNGFVDRILRFSVFEGGSVGSMTDNTVWLNWTNLFVSSGGSFDGIVNLSATGGLRSYSVAGDEWDGAGGVNGGFPLYFKYLDVYALAVSPVDAGHMLLAAGTAGQLSANYGWRGLWEKQGTGPWTRLAEDVFPDEVPITHLAFSPDGTSFVVGTGTSFAHDAGFYVTDDGVEFREFGSELDPGIDTNPNVQAVYWAESGDIYVAVQAFGVYLSDDGGLSFTRVEDPGIVLIGDIAESHQTGDFLVGGNGEMVVRSTDSGVSWTSLKGDLDIVSNVSSVTVDPDDDDVIVIGTEFNGLWRTVNGGVNWTRVANTQVADNPSNGRAPRVGRVAFEPGSSSDDVWAVATDVGLIHSEDNGATWTLGSQTFNTNASSLALSADDPDQVLMGTVGGGVFSPGGIVPLDETIIPNADVPEGLDLGLSLHIGDGTIAPTSDFRVICQDFQGYIIWRSKGTNPDDREAIGVFDKTNPETCYESYCGQDNYNIDQNCFSEKRAACFDFTTPGQAVFFDDNVFNGFEYLYAVGTFDYGNIASVEDPHGLNAEMVLSEIDPVNDMVHFQVNVEATSVASGERPYAYPNPLRRGVGMPSSVGEKVVFANLPPNSEIQIFSLEGTEVKHLTAEMQDGGNHFWYTRHEENNELLASGVYIWKLVVPGRDDYYDKVVIIR